jgi:hypothetical protein
MKRISLFLLITFFQFIGIAQNFSWYYNTEWSQVQEVRQMCIDNSGNIIAAGRYFTVTSTGQPKGAFIMKLDSSGNLLWEVHGDGAFHINGVTTDNENIFLSTRLQGNVTLTNGTTINSNPSDFTFVLIKLNQQGNTIWTKLIPEGEGGKIFHYDTKLYMVGSTSLDSAYFDSLVVPPYHWYLTQADTAGNFLWLHHSSGLFIQPLEHDINVYNGKINFAAGNTSQGITTIQYDTAGTFQWSKNLNLNQAPPRGIASDDNGNVYVVANPALIRYDNQGNHTGTWAFNQAKGWDVVYKNNALYVNGICNTWDNPGILDIFGLGYNGSPSSVNNFFLTKVDLNGAGEWVYFAKSGFFANCSMETTGNGNIISSATSSFPELQYNDTIQTTSYVDVLIFSIEDTNFTTTVSNLSTKSSDFKIYPNPSKGELKIEAPDVNYEVIVNDLNGKKLLSKKLSGSATLDFSAIRSKTVVVEIYVKGKKVQAEKVVVQ